jgi:hypothetical protein
MPMDDQRQLSAQLAEGHEFVAIHYATQSFFDAKDAPLEVSAVAFHFVSNSTTVSFSRADAPAGSSALAAEKFVLESMSEVLAKHSDSTFIHWNMNRAEFGFSALEKRWAYLLPGAPAPAAPHNFVDVDEMVKATFGKEYAPHPRLESLAKLNTFDVRSFKTGKEEAALFSSDNWQTIGRSTSSKARIIAEIFIGLLQGNLRTANSAGLIEFAEAPLDAVATVLQIGTRYSDVLRALSKRERSRVPVVSVDEYDDQYVVHALLALFFQDIRAEEHTPSYAAGSSRIDFLLPEHGLAIELKHSRPSLTDRDLADELIVDKARYAGHPQVTHLVALVMDLERILTNPHGIERELSENSSDSSLTVTVMIVDR